MTTRLICVLELHRFSRGTMPLSAIGGDSLESAPPARKSSKTVSPATAAAAAAIVDDDDHADHDFLDYDLPSIVPSIVDSVDHAPVEAIVEALTEKYVSAARSAAVIFACVDLKPITTTPALGRYGQS